MADSNRLTEALKELADALPRAEDGQQLQIRLLVTHSVFEEATDMLGAAEQVAGHDTFEVICGHCRIVFDSNHEACPVIVTLR